MGVEGVESVTTPSGASQLHLHGASHLPAPQDSQRSPVRPSVLSPRSSDWGADATHGTACPLVPQPWGGGVCGRGRHPPALFMLGKEWIIILGPATSATNLRGLIVEQVERQKIGTSIQPATRVIK